MNVERSAERVEFLGDIISAALEGGIGYWSQCSQYQYELNGEIKVAVGKRQGDEPRATVHELNDDESGYKDEGLEITLEAVEKGLDMILGELVAVAEYHRESISRASDRNDAGDIDADDADVIVQVALFGAIVYG
jgi:hypothetical protein